MMASEFAKRLDDAPDAVAFGAVIGDLFKSLEAQMDDAAMFAGNVEDADQ